MGSRRRVCGQYVLPLLAGGRATLVNLIYELQPLGHGDAQRRTPTGHTLLPSFQRVDTQHTGEWTFRLVESLKSKGRVFRVVTSIWPESMENLLVGSRLIERYDDHLRAG